MLLRFHFALGSQQIDWILQDPVMKMLYNRLYQNFPWKKNARDLYNLGGIFNNPRFILSLTTGHLGEFAAMFLPHEKLMSSKTIDKMRRLAKRMCYCNRKCGNVKCI